MHAALHVDPPLAAIAGVLAADGLRHFQTTLRNPQRFGNTDVPPDDDSRAYRSAVAAGPPLWGLVHGSLLVNLASPEGRIRNASVSSILGDLGLARALGLAGVCFHVGYAKVTPTGRRPSSSPCASSRRWSSRLRPGSPPSSRTPARAASSAPTWPRWAGWYATWARPPTAWALIDTCHLHAAGFDLSGAAAGDRLADALGGEGLLERLVAFHLNDCKGAVGCRRDRHEVPGEGSIGHGLVSIARHPAFRGLPAILELAVEDARRGVAYLAREGVLGGAA